VFKRPFVFNFLEKLNYERILLNNTNPLELLDQLNIPKERNTSISPKILIVTKKIDIEADLLGIQFLKHGIEYLKLTEEDIPLNFGCEFRIGKKNKFRVVIKGRKTNLQNIKIVLLRHFDPKFLNYFSGIRQTYFVQQWYQTFLCLQQILKCVWINDPQKTFDAENRLNQLLTAQRIGFNIPETSITNHPDVGRRFFDENFGTTLVKVLHHHEIIHKCMSYRFLATKIENSHLSKFDELSYSPVIFQKRIEIDSEIRVTIIGDNIFSCDLSTSHGKKYFDLHRIKEKDLKYKEINLEKKIEKLCLKLNKELKLLVSSIDFIVDKKGEIVFLEINPVGDWNWIEKHTNLPITKSMFDFVNSLLKKNRLHDS